MSPNHHKRRCTWWPIVLLAVVTLIGELPLHAEGPVRVLMILREASADMEFMIENEVNPMLELLQEVGFAVDMADASGAPIIDGQAELTPDLKLSDANIDNYAGIVIPCMEAGESAGNTPEAGIKLMKQAWEQGKLIAAQHSLEMVGAARLVSLFGSDSPVAWSGGVVVYKNLITSGNCPYMAKKKSESTDTEALIKCFVNMVKKQQAEATPNPSP